MCCCVRKWGAFLRFNRSIMLPLMRSKWGAQRPMPENPIFTVFRGVQQRTSYRRAREIYIYIYIYIYISGVVLGHHAEDEAVQNTFCFFLVAPPCGFHWACCSHFQPEGKNAQNSGEMGFLHFQSQTCHTKLKIGVLEKMPKCMCWAAPILIFVFFGGAPGFSQQQVSKMDRFWLKPLKTECQSGDAAKRNFCTEGSEIGYLSNGNKMVPRYFSLHCTSFPIQFQKDKENCLIFFAFSLDNRSLSIIFND